MPRRVETMQMFRRLAHNAGRAILLSTHDLDLALRSADRLWLLPRGGPLIEGIPEALVLNGSLAEVFRADGVEFGLEDGSFRMERVTGRCASVLGDGPSRQWTVRALQRMGWTVQDGAPVCVHVLRDLTWRLEVAGHVSDSGSGLPDLLTAVGPGNTGT